MAQILRMQGLDAKAGTEDIRTFFGGERIPDGGVFVVGGSLREAFVAFSSDGDAQLAMRRTGCSLKGSKVSLHTSSMDELEDRLQPLLKGKKSSRLSVRKPQPHSHDNVAGLNARPRDDNPANLSSSPAWPQDPDTANLPQSNPQHGSPPDTGNLQHLDSSSAFLLGICTVLQGLSSTKADVPKAESAAALSEVITEQTTESRPGYARLFGLPASTTKEDISRLFKGLSVQEVIVNVKLGVNYGCLVKFSKKEDALNALSFNQQPLGSGRVEVRAADEKMWIGSLQECEDAFDVGVRLKDKQHALKEVANHRSEFKRRPVNQFSSKPPKSLKTSDDSNTLLPPTTEYVVAVSNLPKSITKTEIKELFGCPKVPHTNVLHLLDRHGKTTDTSFLIFNCTEDFEYAMNLSGCHVGSGAIVVSSITREIMREMMDKTNPKQPRTSLRDPRKQRERQAGPGETSQILPSRNMDQETQTCLFVRNIPADVKKSQIRGLFSNYKVEMGDIILLKNSDGNGTGEAVVKFESEKLAALAHRMHGKYFLGAKVILTPINMKQMDDILANV
ncbi:RNA binding motif protein 12Ba [Cololabis saira]|uniref:RNA binding motif protein 12Ba n=1 Tax=Cololabis saira TaxID=129043 RepID=UPI002AD3EDFC|nr:RNA binding motif protein 12Ba [Cololabis saira]